MGPKGRARKGEGDFLAGGHPGSSQRSIERWGQSPGQIRSVSSSPNPDGPLVLAWVLGGEQVQFTPGEQQAFRGPLVHIESGNPPKVVADEQGAQGSV